MTNYSLAATPQV